jgi:hypothetical protein
MADKANFNRLNMAGFTVGDTDWAILKSLSPEQLEAAGIKMEDVEKGMEEAGLKKCIDTKELAPGKTASREHWEIAGKEE